MQTFLPFADFIQTAKCLDRQRLGKQRIESKQIIDTIVGGKKGWSNHPAVNMWRGFEDALRLYFNIISQEWLNRGYKHNMGFYNVSNPRLPHWIGDADFHLSHQSNLVRKFPEHYKIYFPNITNDLPYVWPV